MVAICSSSCVLLSLALLVVCSRGEWITKTFTQPVDHFNYVNRETFEQRYLVTEEFYKPGGPVFFYTGNEAPIDTLVLAANTGLQLDLAPLFHAVVVSAEHRYYGASLPFGQDSWDHELIGYLSVPQALSDFAALIDDLRSTYHTDKVIVFGGSYGALLSAWMRIHYPALVTGAIASAAPINYFANTSGWMESVSATYREQSSQCFSAIQTAFNDLYTSLIRRNSPGTVKADLNLCYDVTSVADSLMLLEYMQFAFSSIAQFGYPYPFLMDVGWPVVGVCNAFAKWDAKTALKFALGVWYNSSRSPRPCFDYKNLNVQNLTTIQTNSWLYQCCTEVFLGMQSDGQRDMFFPSPFNYSQLYDRCQQTYGIRRPSYQASSKQLGEGNSSAASNIFFAYGGNDPVRAFAVSGALPSSSIAYVIPKAAHCLILYPIAWLGNQTYPELLAARKLQTSYVSQWLGVTPAKIKV